MNSNIFMAFAKGGESTEGTAIKRYTGVAPVKILSINPNKAELEKLFDTTLENEPEYIGEIESNGTKVPSARVTFVVQPIVDFEVKPISVTLFLRKEYKFNKDKTKIRVIDEFGNVGWATKEECQAHTQLMSKTNKPLKISTNYRPVYTGEAELTDFIKAYLFNIPEAFEYVNETWVLKKDAELSIARFENIDKLFTGDFSEVKEAISYQPENKVKVLFGVRKTDEGKLYQSFYKEMFLKNNVKDYSKLSKDVQERKNAGAYPNTEFEITDFKEYTVTPTNFEEKAAEDPFASQPNNPWFNA